MRRHGRRRCLLDDCRGSCCRVVCPSHICWSCRRRRGRERNGCRTMGLLRARSSRFNVVKESTAPGFAFLLPFHSSAPRHRDHGALEAESGNSFGEKLVKSFIQFFVCVCCGSRRHRHTLGPSGPSPFLWFWSELGLMGQSLDLDHGQVWEQGFRGRGFWRSRWRVFHVDGNFLQCFVQIKLHFEGDRDRPQHPHQNTLPL